MDSFSTAAGTGVAKYRRSSQSQLTDTDTDAECHTDALLGRQRHWHRALHAACAWARPGQAMPRCSATSCCYCQARHSRLLFKDVHATTMKWRSAWTGARTGAWAWACGLGRGVAGAHLGHSRRGTESATETEPRHKKREEKGRDESLIFKLTVYCAFHYDFVCKFYFAKQTERRAVCIASFGRAALASEHCGACCLAG